LLQIYKFMRKANDGKKGGYLIGQSHQECNDETGCGIRAIVTDAGGKPVELEGDEVILTKKAMADEGVYEIKGTPKEIASYINNKIGGGVKFDDAPDSAKKIFRSGGKIKKGDYIVHVSDKKSLSKITEEPMHFGTLEQSYNRSDALNYGNDARFYKTKVKKDWKIYDATDKEANILAKDLPTGFDYDAIRYENEVEGEGTSYIVLTEEIDIEPLEQDDFYALGGGVDGKKIKFPKVTFEDVNGKEFIYQGGKFLIFDYPNYVGAWTNKGRQYRKTAKHNVTIIKLDDVTTDMDKALWQTFQATVTQQDPLIKYNGLPSLSVEGSLKKLKDMMFEALSLKVGVDEARKLFAKGGDVISDKVKFLIKEEGYPKDQATAIAYSMQERGELALGGGVESSNYGDVKPETKKLLDSLLKNVFIKEGDIQTASDGEKYRYDTYKAKYPNTPKWMSIQFDRASAVNDAKFQNNFFDGDWSFNIDRAQYKGQSDGRIRFSRLVVLGYDKKAKGGGVDSPKGDCYVIAGQVAMGIISKEIDFVGTPYVVHGIVTGQGAIEGLKYGHAWIEDDENVYDWSNGRELVFPKAIYYMLGEIEDEDGKIYRYTFDEAREKMLDTGHYGSWDLKTKL